MALIVCPECGRDVSDRASTCVHCGFPLIEIETESKTMTTWDVTVNEVALSCKQCGRVSRFGKGRFSSVASEGVIPSSTIKCSICGAESKGGVMIPYKLSIKYSVDPPQVKCPRCGSTNIQAFKEGFNVGNAVVGQLLFGTAGAILGGKVNNNKLGCYCLNCKKKF